MRWPIPCSLLATLILGCAEHAGRFETASTTHKVTNRQQAQTTVAHVIDEVPKKQATATKPDFVLSAEEMAKECVADRRQAERKFGGKFLEVIGTVDYVSCKHMTGPRRTMVKFVGVKKDEKAKLPFSVCCTVLPKDDHKVTRLFRGQKVKVTGECSRWYSYSAELFPCEITELEPSKIITRTDVQVAEAFDKDPKAAEATYSKKEDMILKGTVADWLDEWTERKGSPVVMLNGTGKTQVFVHLCFQDWQRLRKGKKVEFRIQGGIWPSSRTDPPNFPKDFEMPAPAGNGVYCGGFIIK